MIKVVVNILDFTGIIMCNNVSHAHSHVLNVNTMMIIVLLVYKVCIFMMVVVNKNVLMAILKIIKLVLVKNVRKIVLIANIERIIV